jgi:hypothetical protein
LANAKFLGERGDAACVFDCFVEWAHRCRSSRFVLFQSTLIVLDEHHSP